jgi:hypothetical protein
MIDKTPAAFLCAAGRASSIWLGLMADITNKRRFLMPWY